MLILGANGFLGRNLLKKCLDLKWDVTPVYHIKRGFIPEDIRSINVEDVFKMNVRYDVIFLLSAFIPYGDLNSTDKRLIETNIKIPLRISEKFEKSKIVYSSSVSVYGNHRGTIKEDSSLNQPGNYGLSKLAGEVFLRFHPKHQIIRFSSLYGYGMYEKTFIPLKIVEARKHKTITLFGDGSRRQDYLYIDDAVGYLIAAAYRKEPGVYLGVNGNSYSNTEVGEIIKNQLLGCKLNYVGSDNDLSFVYNNLLTRKILKFTPKISFKEGIKKMITQV